MALPTVFNNLPGSGGIVPVPAADLDNDFNAVGAMAITACAAAGVNAITLSPLPNQTPVLSYANLQVFSFVAVNNSTGPVTAQVGALGLVPIFLPSLLQAGSGVIAAGSPYFLMFIQALNNGGGGLVIMAFGGVFLPRTRTVLASGTGTYTTPVFAAQNVVHIVGGGGGGAGSGTGAGNGTAGGNTTFGSLTGTGAGAGLTNGAAGAGGGSSGGDWNFTGSGGGQIDGGTANQHGGLAAASIFGGTGTQPNSGNSGFAAAANTGSGGSGAGCGATVSAGGGGGAGGYCNKLFVPPAATYSYAVGTAGAGGTAGTNGFAGGNGAAGIIVIEELYS